MPDTVAIPETVTIPTETLMEVASELYSLDDVLTAFNGYQDTPTAEEFTRLASRLLSAVAPSPRLPAKDDFYDDRHPIVVETFARAHEANERRLGELGAGAKYERERAAAIRSAAHAFPEDAVMFETFEEA